MFDTYGDGLCQHSPEWTVPVEFLTDYLASLAAAALKDRELALAMRYTINRGLQRDISYDFASKVIHKEPVAPQTYLPRRYFSRDLRKISASDKCRHDKRYEEIDSGMDGSPLGMLRVLRESHWDWLETYGCMYGMALWFGRVHDRSIGYPADLLDATAFSGDRARELDQAYTLCLKVIEGHQAFRYVEEALPHFQPKPAPLCEFCDAPKDPDKPCAYCAPKPAAEEAA
ncbi:MAG: hypothetical protein NVS1B6_00100 [Steroidobacteraceae bacterium]